VWAAQELELVNCSYSCPTYVFRLLARYDPVCRDIEPCCYISYRLSEGISGLLRRLGYFGSRSVDVAHR